MPPSSLGCRGTLGSSLRMMTCGVLHRRGGWSSCVKIWRGLSRENTRHGYTAPQPQSPRPPKPSGQKSAAAAPLTCPSVGVSCCQHCHRPTAAALHTAHHLHVLNHHHHHHHHHTHTPSINTMCQVKDCPPLTRPLACPAASTPSSSNTTSALTARLDPDTLAT